jgi:hypothetical protein
MALFLIIGVEDVKIVSSEAGERRMAHMPGTSINSHCAWEVHLQRSLELWTLFAL